MASITFLIGPAAAGKTETALGELAGPRRGRAILLLPSALHRQRLLPRLNSGRLSVGTFTRVAGALARAGGARLRLASQATRITALRAALRAEVAAGRLPRFAGVATKRGLAEEALRLIGELRAGAIDPQRLADAGVTPYDAELAAIYRAYLAALDRLGLTDEEGLILHARNLVATNPRLTHSLDLLVVDGFDQMTAVQMSLVAALARRAQRALITLTGDTSARPAHQRFTRTLEALRAALPEARVTYLPRHAALAPALTHIESHLFTLALPLRADAGGAVTIIGAPDREREVRAALRHIRGLLAAGVAPEEVALLYRGGDLYPALVREVAAEYGIAVALFEGQPLGETPPVAALRALLELPLASYPRRALVECWRALDTLAPAELLGVGVPPIATFATAAALLDRATRAGGAARGLPRLRGALAALAGAAPPLPDDEERPTVTPVEAAALLALLDAFAAWLDPPPVAAPGTYVDWVRRLLGWQQPHAQQAGATPQPFPFSQTQVTLLQRLLDEREEVARMLDEPPLTLAAFVDEFGGLLDRLRDGGETPQAGKVAVLPMLAARGSAFAHVVALGLGEGEIPAPAHEPPFYTRREWALLAARGAAPPPPDFGDERSLFYEAVTRARTGLTLTYTRLDERGNEIRPSPYLRAVTNLFAGGVAMREIRAGSAPDPNEAASPQEALIAYAIQKNDLAQAPAGAPLDLVEHVRRAIAVERQRASAAPHGPYEGLVTHPAALETLRHRFGPDYRWSATAINDYTLCPYRFAATHVLQLAPRDDPEEGLTATGRGRIYHAILARAGARWARLNQPFDAAGEEQILAALSAAADEVLNIAPQTYGFEPGPFWDWERQDVRATLMRAVRRWLRDADGWEGFRPAGFEERFGLDRGLPPLRLETPAGAALVAGRIDRIDQDGQGRLALIDYKSGSDPGPLDRTLNGQDVQLTLYVIAAEQQLAGPGQSVERAAFLMIGSGRRSRPLTPARRPEAEAALRERLAAAISGSRTGVFPVHPTEKCPPACAFATVCRVNRDKAPPA
ncbi:MAG: PD-(D/E)XK nuclease family protein [Chloroflexaceae bacterium]